MNHWSLRLNNKERKNDWINEIPTVPIYYLAKPQPRERAWQNHQGKETLLGLTLTSMRATAFVWPTYANEEDGSLVEEHGHADDARDSPAEAGRHCSRVDSTGYAPQLCLIPERTENGIMGALTPSCTQITHTGSTAPRGFS